MTISTAKTIDHYDIWELLELFEISCLSFKWASVLSIYTYKYVHTSAHAANTYMQVAASTSIMARLGPHKVYSSCCVAPSKLDEKLGFGFRRSPCHNLPPPAASLCHRGFYRCPHLKVVCLVGWWGPCAPCHPGFAELSALQATRNCTICCQKTNTACNLASQ